MKGETVPSSWMVVRRLAEVARIVAGEGLARRVKGVEGHGISEVLDRLGGAFVKGAQILSTRRDLVGAELAGELARLQDRVRPMPAGDALQVIAAVCPSCAVRARPGVEAGAVASGSIACVYRVPGPAGDIALKVRRPEAWSQLHADTRIIRWAARLLARLPGASGIPVREIADQVCEAVLMQLDFDRERLHLERFSDAMADAPGVVVPRVVPAMCHDGVLAMEYVEDLRRTRPHEMGEAERSSATQLLVSAVYRSVFLVGLAHLDLHQGNAYLIDQRTVAVIDFGFAYQLSESARRRFAQFIGGMIESDGPGCAETLLASATGRLDDADLVTFRRDVSRLVEVSAGRSVAQFSLPEFAGALFDIQRRCGVYADPEFVFPILCLLALEGAVNEWAPDMDFQLEAAPYVLTVLLEADVPGSLEDTTAGSVAGIS
ncbi:AarF/UbiB family protein [Blastococcus montanus]|uniref:ABC1 kinase family protein n=1 Tax=Blastococcus montanus TaxID=3144973 RepID=UPI003209F3B2